MKSSTFFSTLSTLPRAVIEFISSLKPHSMAFNLVDSVKGLFGNEITGKAASMLGENEANLKIALAGIVPTVLTGLLQKAGSGDAQGLLNMTKDASQSGFLNNFSGLLTNSGLLTRGTEMVKSLFGDKIGNITTMITNFAGIKASSATSLMSMAAPAALGVVGQQAADTKMTASGLLSFLNSQKDQILSAVPPDLNLAGALGLGSLAAIGSRLSNAAASFTENVSSTASNIARGAVAKSVGNRWIVPLLIAIVAIALLLYFGKSCSSPDKNAAAVVDTISKTADAA
jgi:hypothetical protein